MVNIFHLAIALINGNQIDGQLPNDVKTKFLFPFFLLSCMCVCKGYKTVRMSTSFCSRGGYVTVYVSACMFSSFFFFLSSFKFHFHVFPLLLTMQLIWYFPLVSHELLLQLFLSFSLSFCLSLD